MDLHPIQGYKGTSGSSRLGYTSEAGLNRRSINRHLIHSSDSSCSLLHNVVEIIVDSLSQDERYYPKMDSMYHSGNYTLHSTGLTPIRKSPSDYPYPRQIDTCDCDVFLPPFPTGVPSAMTQSPCLPSRPLTQPFASKPENNYFRAPFYSRRTYFPDQPEFQSPEFSTDYLPSTHKQSQWAVPQVTPDKTPVREQERQHVLSMTVDNE